MVHLSPVYNESLSDVNILYGLPQELSYKIVIQMIICTGKLQLVNKPHPNLMKEDAVCSLGGITIVNVKTLEQKKDVRENSCFFNIFLISDSWFINKKSFHLLRR